MPTYIQNSTRMFSVCHCHTPHEPTHFILPRHMRPSQSLKKKNRLSQPPSSSTRRLFHDIHSLGAEARRSSSGVATILRDPAKHHPGTPENAAPQDNPSRCAIAPRRQRDARKSQSERGKNDAQRPIFRFFECYAQRSGRRLFETPSFATLRVFPFSPHYQRLACRRHELPSLSMSDFATSRSPSGDTAVTGVHHARRLLRLHVRCFFPPRCCRQNGNIAALHDCPLLLPKSNMLTRAQTRCCHQTVVAYDAGAEAKRSKTQKEVIAHAAVHATTLSTDRRRSRRLPPLRSFSAARHSADDISFAIVCHVFAFRRHFPPTILYLHV